jgi:poly-gamma-glutamate synthesis protein (capsule biosynthesis protein)
LHWGVEYSPFPTEKQTEMAKKFFAEGADVILGGHPHVLQPADIININGSKKFVVYSMGNCIGNQNGVERNSGVIIRLTFKKNQTTGKTELQSYQYTPTFSDMYMQNGRRNFRVIPVPETIQEIKAGRDPYLHSDSIPLLESVIQDCDDKMSVD